MTSDASVGTYIRGGSVCVGSAAGRVWKVLLDPVSDSRPYTITAQLLASPAHTIRLRDVLFGDVWLCVGQNRLHHSVAKVTVSLLLSDSDSKLHDSAAMSVRVSQNADVIISVLIFFILMAGLQKFAAAFRLSRQTSETYFLG